jgi:uroporphyrinogen decarboxylase
VLLGDPAAIRARTAEMLALARGHTGEAAAPRYIANLGHGILPETPPDHAQLFVETIRSLSAIAPSPVSKQVWP